MKRLLKSYRQELTVFHTKVEANRVTNYKCLPSFSFKTTTDAFENHEKPSFQASNSLLRFSLTLQLRISQHQYRKNFTHKKFI